MNTKTCANTILREKQIFRQKNQAANLVKST